MKNLFEDFFMFIGFLAVGMAMFFVLWSIMMILNG